MAAGGFLERWAHDEQLLVEQGNDLEIVFRDGQRNKRQVKPPFVQTGNHLFRYPDGNADLGMREPAAQLPERPAELVDERGDAGREMKRTRVLGDRSEEHTSELQSHSDLVCRLLLEKKK